MREMSIETRAYLRELRFARSTAKRTAKAHADAQAEADAWNAAHPPRVPVIVTKDLGEQVATFTRSIAWRICDHAAVLVDGISGGYLLERVRFDLSRADVVAAEAARNLAAAYHPHRDVTP